MKKGKFSIIRKKKLRKRPALEKFALVFVGMAIVFGASAVLYSLLSTKDTQRHDTVPQAKTFTDFDEKLALQFMDKDNDGKCDICGMPIEMCISSGQLQCSMDPKSTIGVLGSQHIHADLAVYVDGKKLDLNDKKYFVRSKFVHAEEDAQGDSGDVIHIHATGVPLWIFFESIGMRFNKECLVLDDGTEHCANDGKTLKFFVNGKPNEQYEQYVFRGLDKILISYGDEEEDVTEQLASVTSFAKNH